LRIRKLGIRVEGLEMVPDVCIGLGADDYGRRVANLDVVKGVDFWFLVQGSGFRVEGLGFRVQGLCVGCRV